MAELIAGIGGEQRQADSTELAELMASVTGEPAVLWSASTIGFGQYHYKYKTGQVGDFFKVGFRSPQGQDHPLHHVGSPRLR